MNQGGGFTSDYKKVKTKDTITNEADNGLKNLKYTVAMARTGERSEERRVGKEWRSRWSPYH